MSRTRTRLTRLLVAALVAVPSAVVLAPATSAAPTKQEVEQAQARAAELEHQLELAIEQYNEADYRLSQEQARLTEAKTLMDTAQKEAAAARAQLSDRAVQAYTGMGSQFGALLGSEDFTQFSDQLEFMGAIAQSDANLASEADAAGQRAQWTAQEYAGVIAQRQVELDQMAQKRSQIQQMLAEQEQLARTLNQDYQDYIAAQEAAAAAAAAAEAAAAANDGSDPAPTGGVGDTSGGGDTGGGVYVPPANTSAAQIAIDAAKSVIGTQYVWGSADPNVGFDCSGLTSWAWAQAGVYIPHSSASQYATLPHVSLSEIQPGDLLFFYSPISHVALYIGGGMMIHARHPGPGGQVQYTALSAYDPAVGAARPG